MSLLREMVEITEGNKMEQDLLNEFDCLKLRFHNLLESASMLVESNLSAVEGDMMAQMDELSKRFEAAKRGLGLVNKLSPGPTKSKHMSRIMGNLNRIRGMLRQVEKQIVLQNDTAA